MKDSSYTDPRIVHAQDLKSSNIDLFVFDRLVILYSKSTNSLFSSYANRLLSNVPFPSSAASWASLISAHSRSTLSLRYFCSMLRHRFLPTQPTLAILFKSCAALSAFSSGLALHCLSLKLSHHSRPVCGSALISFYGKLGFPGEARKVFDEVPHRDEVCYGALIVGLTQNSHAADALVVFAEMRNRNVGSTVYTVSGVLRAATEMAAAERCRVIHGHSLVAGYDRDVVVANGLIDGYGKVGLVGDARKVFDEFMPFLNSVGWNSLMAAYAQTGDSGVVIELFNKMEAKGLLPDEFSFLSLLTAFCNSGLFVECKWWFKRMRVEYRVEPVLDHYTCLVGAMGRAGRLEEAERIAMTMPFEPDAAVWRMLLSSCAYHGNVDMALVMAGRLLELDPCDKSAYLIAANTLSAEGRWGEVQEVRKLMRETIKAKKEGGKSWIELKGEVDEFFSSDNRHGKTEEIYTILAELMGEIDNVSIWDEKQILDYN